MPTIGTYRHCMTLEQPGVPVADGDGGFTETYAPLDPAIWWGSIKPATVADSQRVVAGTMQSTATHLIRGRFHPGITDQTRITHEGTVYEVLSVQNDDERNLTLTLICVEIKYGVSQSTEDRRAGGTPGGVVETTGGAHD